MDGVSRFRRNGGLAWPGNGCKRRSSARRAMAAYGPGPGQDPQGAGGLLGNNSVAQSGQLGGAPQPRCAGHPAGRKALHPLHEPRTQVARSVGRPRCGTGGTFPAGDRVGVRPPDLGPSCTADGSPNSGSDCARGVLLVAPFRCPVVRVGVASGVGRRRAAAEGRVKSPLPWRWLGESLVRSEAFGVGRSHSISSARFGPWPPCLRFAGCWLPPLAPRLLVGVLRSGDPSGWPGGEEDPLSAVRGSDVGGAKHAPARIEPDVGQGAEYGAECAHRRLACGVSQTPRAEFHVARGTGGRGEEPSDILDHHKAWVEDFDGTDDVVPQTGPGAISQSGATAGDRDVFDRGSRPSGRTPPGLRPSSRP